MRSFLTMLGIVIGVAAVITMVTLGNGATQSVTDQISSMGSNLLIVVPGQRFGPGADGAPPFKSADVEAIRDQITAAERVAPMVEQGGDGGLPANNWSTVVPGTSDDLLRGRQLEARRGPHLHRDRGARRQGRVRDRRDRARASCSAGRTRSAARSASSSSRAR